MDEFDKLRLEINKGQQVLEDLEDDFRRQKSHIEELYERVDSQAAAIRLKNEVTFAELDGRSRQMEMAVSEAYPETSQLLNKMAEDMDYLTRLDHQILDDRLERLERDYHRNYRKQEDKVEGLLAKLRLMD